MCISTFLFTFAFICLISSNFYARQIVIVLSHKSFRNQDMQVYYFIVFSMGRVGGMNFSLFLFFSFFLGVGGDIRRWIAASISLNYPYHHCHYLQSILSNWLPQSTPLESSMRNLVILELTL